MRSISASLSSHIDDLSEINKKEPENRFIDNMRFMMVSLSQSIDKVSEIDEKYHKLIKKNQKKNL